MIRVQMSVDKDSFKNLQDLSKELDRQVANMEKRLDDLRKKREQALNASSAKNNALNAAQAKLQALQKEWRLLSQSADNAQLPAITRDQSAAAAALTAAQLDTQKSAVQTVQDEFQKAAACVQMYDQEISAAAADLEQQRLAAAQAAAELANAEQQLLLLSQSAEVSDQHIVDLRRTLDALKNRQDTLESAGLGLGFQEYDQNLKQINDISAELKAYQNSLHSAASLNDASRLSATLNKIGESFLNHNSLSSDGWLGELQSLKDGLQQAAAAVADAWEQSLASVQKKISGIAHSLAAAAQNAASLVFQSAAAFKNLLPLLKNWNAFLLISQNLQSLFLRLGRSLQRAFMDASAGNAVAFLRRELNAFLAVDQQFCAALNQIRGVLLTAFQPIYEAALPAISSLVHWAAQAVAVVSQFTAALFGTTPKNAQKNAQALYQQAHALNAVGSAAKKAETAIAPFDDFHILNFHDSSGSGASSSNPDSPTFDFSYDSLPVDSWGLAFSAFLDQLLAAIPALENAFLQFARWLNHFSKNLLEMFSFPGVLEKVQRLGSDLAAAFNLLVASIDWLQLGQALGAGLNLALQFLSHWLYDFDWLALGRSLAAFLNGIAAYVDWFHFGSLLWSGFHAAIQTAAGFLLGLDMPLLAQAASLTALGFFQEMLRSIQSIPWDQIGSQIAAFLNHIQWFDVLSSIFTAAAAAFSALLDLLRAFVQTLQWHDIAAQIFSAVNASFAQVDWLAAGQTLGDAFLHIFSFLRDLIAGIHWYQLGVDIGSFLVGIDWVAAFGALAQTLAAAIGAAVSAAKGFLDTIAPHVQDIARGIAQKLNDFFRTVDWAEVGRVISDGLKLALDFVIVFLQSVDWNAIGAAIVSFLENIDWASLLSLWSSLVGEAMTAALAALPLDGIVDVGKNVVEGLLRGILEKIASIGSWLKDHFVDPIVNGVKNLFGIHSPSTVFADIGKLLVEGLLLGISESWSSIVQFLSTKLNDILSSVSSAWNALYSATSSAWNNLLTLISSVWTSLRDLACSVFAAIQESIRNAWIAAAADSAAKWTDIASSISQNVDSIRSFVSDGFAHIKTELSSTLSNTIQELKNKDWASVGYSIVDGILSGLKSIFQQLSSWASQVWNSITGSFSSSKAKASVSSAVSSRRIAPLSAAAVPDIQSLSLPRLANGAVIPPNRQFAAILGDQRQGLNVETPLATIEKALQNVLSRNTFAGDIHITVESILDGSVIARNTVRHINDMTASAGKSVLLL